MLRGSARCRQSHDLAAALVAQLFTPAGTGLMHQRMEAKKSAKQVSISDIAEALGLTASTISRALNGNPRISEATRERVIEQARLMNYNYNGAAASLRTGKSQILGVIIPLINRAFFASVISGIESVANAGGYSVMICQTSEGYENEKAAVAALMKARVDGIAISVSAETRRFDHYASIRQAGIPLILFDRTFDEVQANQIVIDDRMGGRLATEHLIEQGCRRILHLGGPQHMSIYANRTQGFVDALLGQQLKLQPERQLFTALNEQSGSEAVEQLLAKGIAFDGLFAASDYAAIGAMRRLQAHGLRVPEDVAVIGFANEPFTRFVSPGLSSVDQHSEEMGKAVAKLFLSLLGNEQDAKAMPQTKLVISPSLIVRESSLRKG